MFYSITLALLTVASTDAFSFNRPNVFSRRSTPILSMSTPTQGDLDALAKARSAVDDIAQIKEGRTVDLSKYRNIGIMVR